MNPLTVWWAQGFGWPYALLTHTGRRSGRAYRTPLVALGSRGGFLVPLTYGGATDWYRNLRANGRGVLHWRGRDYPAGRVRTVGRADALGMLGPGWRLLFTLVRVPTFVEIAPERHAPDQ